MDSLIASELKIMPQSGALGAHIFGADLAAMTRERRIGPVLAALRAHHVICLRGQQITPAQHLDFSRQMGEIYVQPSVAGLQDYPEIVEVKGTSRLTECWHSDSTHSPRPPRFSILAARRLPTFGNDTMFANQHLALEALSPVLQAVLQTLRAVHRTAVVSDPRYKMTGTTEENIHPVIRTHPDTGRKALFVNSQYTRHFAGMTEAESAPLLNFLYQHGSRAEFTWRHQWQAGDVLIWDNPSVQHMVVADLSQDVGRLLHRTTTLGDAPV